MIYEEILNKAGFDQKETKVYLAALELGSAPASVISKKAGVVRSTSYGILEELVKRGLASKSERSGVLWFNVDSPERLKDYIKSQKESLDVVEKQINEFMPDLKKLQSQYGFKPQVEFYEGDKGISIAMESTKTDIKRMAKLNIPILINGQTTQMTERWSGFTDFVAWRSKIGVKIKMFVPDMDKDELDPRIEAARKSHYQIKKVPEKSLYKAGSYILDEKIVLFDFENNVTVIIKNKPLVEMIRMMFEWMWESIN